MSQYVHERWGTEQGFPRGPVYAIAQSSDGYLLLSFMERGVIVYRQGRFEMVADASALPRSPVLSVAQTPDGSVWLGTRGAGLFRVRQGQISSVAEGLPDPKVNCLLADVNGNLWVGTDNGIVRWNGTRLVAAGIP